MAELTKKQYLDLDGLKAFWGIIKDKFVSEVAMSDITADGVTFISKNGLGNETTIGTIPMATSTQAGLMSAEQAKTVDEFSDGVAALVPFTDLKVKGTSTTLTNRAANIDFVYNSTAKEIQVVDLNDNSAVLTKIDATAFIKDGMVSDVRIDGNNLVIEFNTDHGKEDIVLPLDKFIDVYTAGNGIDVNTDNVISVKLADTYLTADTTGLKVADALWTKVGELDTAVAEAAAEDATTKANAAQAAAEKKAAELANAAQAAGEAAAAQALADAKSYVDPKFEEITTEIGVKEGENAPTGLYKEIADAEAAAKGYTDNEINKLTAEGTGILDQAKSYTDDEIAKVNKAIEENEKVTAESLTDLDNRVKVLEAVDHDKILQDAKDYTDGKIGTLPAGSTTVADAIAAAVVDTKAYADNAATAVYNAIEAIPVSEITADKLNA